MTDTSHPELIHLDDILGQDGMEAIAHRYGQPAMGLHFHDNVDKPKYIAKLFKAANENPKKFSVYTHALMPKKYHFSNNERIAPIYVVPNIGYVITTTNLKHKTHINRGVFRFCFSWF